MHKERGSQLNDTRHPLHGHTFPKKCVKSLSSFMYDNNKLIDSPSTRRIVLWSNHQQSVPNKRMQTPREKYIIRRNKFIMTHDSYKI